MVTQGLTILVLYAIPLVGLARVDAWGGDHRSLLRSVDIVEALISVFVGIGALYAATFLLNVVAGRMFCGWGCPVGELSRLGEQAFVHRVSTRAARAVQVGRLLASSMVIALGVVLWWVSPRVFVEGSSLAIAGWGGTVIALGALGVLHARYWRWGFCRKLCPIGLYYSVVTTGSARSIVFDAEMNTCKDCHLCDLVCPVHLDPRQLGELKSDIGGLAFESLPALNHCLACGDCVAACEHVFPGKEEQVPLRFGVGDYGRPLKEPSSATAAPVDAALPKEPLPKEPLPKEPLPKEPLPKEPLPKEPRAVTQSTAAAGEAPVESRAQRGPEDSPPLG